MLATTAWARPSTSLNYTYNTVGLCLDNRSRERNGGNFVIVFIHNIIKQEGGGLSHPKILVNIAYHNLPLQISVICYGAQGEKKTFQNKKIQILPYLCHHSHRVVLITKQNTCKTSIQKHNRNYLWYRVRRQSDNALE